MRGVLTPYHIILFSVLFLIVFFYSIILILKNEKKIRIPIWILITLIFPFVGSIIYIFKYFIGRKANVAQQRI